MGLRDTYEWLMNEIKDLEIVDAHEHLPPEKERVSKKVDLFTLFSHYTHADLITAGMKRENYNRILDTSVPLDERWKLFKPYYKLSKHTSYFRAAQIAINEFYGEESLNDTNYTSVSEKIENANRPGLYKLVLKDKCHIKVVLTQIGRIPDADRDFLVPILPMKLFWSQEKLMEAKANKGICSLADYLVFIKEELEEWKRMGVVGVKMISRNIEEIPEKKAYKAFKNLLEGEQREIGVLQDYITEKVIDFASEFGLVVAVHTGIIWTNWQDFTLHNPTYLIPLLIRHQNARFDVYHAGIPWIRETGIMGKSFPNIWLNLCWCHMISQEMTCSALNEWLDLVPVNKIIGFGGDLDMPVEKIYGHLVMAKEDISTVLAQRVIKGHMTKKEALDIAKMWLYENPIILYGLDI
ncbi:MAG: amidohydrolase family protein [Candidatus Bathyarchaeia archaeon]